MERKTILIVEDDKPLLGILKEVIRNYYNVLWGSGFSEAQEHISKPIDLALLDYQLPDGNGIELLKTFRKANPSSPAIIMTGYSTENVVISALRAGAADYIKKPFDVAFLFRKISDLLCNGEGDVNENSEINGSGCVLKGIASYIEKNFAEELTLDMLSAKAGMDRFKFSRAFKARFEEGFTSYLNKVRMRNAVELLNNLHLSITEIAYLCGYGSVEHFDRKFKQLYGRSPREHRSSKHTVSE